MQLHVRRALELLEDDVVQAAAGFDERRAEDRQAAAELDLARRAEEALGIVPLNFKPTSRVLSFLGYVASILRLYLN